MAPATNEDDLTEIGFRNCVPERDLDALTAILAKRFNVQSALVSVIDEVNDRQIFKGATGPDTPWMQARNTPLSQSLCKYVAASNQPLLVSDARTDTRVTGSRAAQDLGVVSYLGVPIRPNDDEAIGALCLIGTSPREWTEQEATELGAFAQGVTENMRQRIGMRALERMEEEAKVLRAALDETRRTLAEFSQLLPGACFRYAVFDDGTDAIEYDSEQCEAIYGYSDEELKGDPSKMWASIHEDDLPEFTASVQKSATEMTKWEHGWRIRTSGGEMKWLRGYGMPSPMENDIGILWHTLVLDVTADQQTSDDAT
jgi:PAS domain S-box-containing protein